MNYNIATCVQRVERFISINNNSNKFILKSKYPIQFSRLCINIQYKCLNKINNLGCQKSQFEQICFKTRFKS